LRSMNRTSYMDDSEVRAAPGQTSWGLLEAFVLLQYLSNAALLLPGAQSLRIAIRALPYLSSFALLILYAHRAPSWKRFPATGLLALALGLMMLEMLHPDTSVFAGLGQIAFTICIAAPAFWVGKVVRNKIQLDRVLYLIFLANALGAFVGFLQARYGLLMPAEFSAVGVGMNREMV